jgi:hypothetical protein
MKTGVCAFGIKQNVLECLYYLYPDLNAQGHSDEVVLHKARQIALLLMYKLFSAILFSLIDSPICVNVSLLSIDYNSIILVYGSCFDINNALYNSS